MKTLHNKPIMPHCSITNSHDIYMRRCFDLARLARGNVSPNPMVGAVLVYQNRIIGEGYHAYYGGPHAEVMTLKSVEAEDRDLVPKSRLYISLEPCNIFGHTPPCVDLILQEKIPHVIIANSDLTPGVQGSGLDRLRAEGVQVEEGVLKEDGNFISHIRNVFIHQKRPYVVLKYAQTQDGFLAPKDGSTFWLTNKYSKMLVHKWRAETDAILIGSATARADNPALTTRLYPGKQPVRLLIDRKENLPEGLSLFDGQYPTWVFSQSPTKKKQVNLRYFALDFSNEAWLSLLMHKMARQKIAHLTVEGGGWLLKQFVASGLWDEARVFTTTHQWGEGLAAPKLGIKPLRSIKLLEDKLSVYYRQPVSSERKIK